MKDNIILEKKSFVITEILVVVLGWLGIHRYYTGYIWSGIFQTLTFGGFGIWALVDLISISLGKYKDANNLELDGYNQNIGIAFLIFAIMLPFFYGLENFMTKESVPENEIVIFGNTKCEVDKYGWLCDGKLSDEEKEKIEKIKMELKFR